MSFNYGGCDKGGGGGGSSGSSGTSAGGPTPPDGAKGVPIDTKLSWAAVNGAACYFVYFSYNNPPSVYDIIWGSTTTSAPPPALSTLPLVYNTTYYWRVDPADENYFKLGTGPVWSFTTIGPPDKVAAPTSANWLTNVPVTAQLSWAPANWATSYEVYFGTSNPPVYRTKITVTNYKPLSLSPNTQYYWRIDSKNSAGTTTGDVWTFTTAP